MCNHKYVIVWSLDSDFHVEHYNDFNVLKDRIHSIHLYLLPFVNTSCFVYKIVNMEVFYEET